MFASRPKTRKPYQAKNSRLRLVSAIIFLLALALLVKLFDLQVRRHDYYAAKADKQQRVSGELKAERGKIFLNSYGDNLSSDDLVEAATNRNYAKVYAVPKDIDPSQAPALADLLYKEFDQAAIESAVDASLSSQDDSELKAELDYVESLPLPADQKAAKKAEVEQRRTNLRTDAAWQKFRQEKRELEINEQRQAVLADYLSKLSKPGDPYEVLQKKIGEDALLHLYAALLTGTSTVPVPAADLELRNGKILKKSEGESKAYFEVSGIAYELEKYRYYPEKNIGSQLLGFVNLENKGNYGLEAYMNDELAGQDGYMEGGKSGSPEGGSIAVADQKYNAPKDGSDIVLTIDRAIEFNACKRLNETVARLKAEGGSIIIVEPATGAIIAMCSAPDFDPNNYQAVKEAKDFDNPAVSYQYEPGSVFKAVTMAIAVDQGKVKPSTTYNDRGEIMINGWPKPIRNSDFETAGGHGTVDMVTVLEKSLNTGAIFAMEQVGANIFTEYVKNFGFGQKTGIELSAEASGNIKQLEKTKVREVDAATASFGQGIAVTPLQMLMSYAALANGGILMKPQIIKEIITGDKPIFFQPQPLRRVVSATTADTIGAMLVKVVDNGHAKAAGVPGYYVGAKTGTAQIPSAKGGYIEGKYIHTMIGYAPIEKPRFVMLVKIDSPKGIKFAEASAAPLFGEIADFLLKYYQVPKAR